MVSMKTTSLIQKLAIVYFFMFIGIVVLDFIPGLKDSEGYLFSLFSLDWYDHSLHLFSGIWAGVAGYLSHRQAVLYFKLFGTVYFLDGIVGMFLGNAYLDLGI